MSQLSVRESDGRRLAVAFDVKRLADGIRRRWPRLGITISTEEQYRHLKQDDRLAMTPVAFADASEPCLLTLDAAVGRVQAELHDTIEVSWREQRTWRAASATAQLLPHLRRGGRLLESLLGIFDRVLYERTPFPSCPRWDIYYSTSNPLPPVQWTGRAVRVLTVNDVIQVKFPQLSPQKTPAVRKALDSVRVDRDYIICISECTRGDVLSLLPIAEERVCVIPLAAVKTFENPCRAKALRALRSVGVEPGQYVLALAQMDPRKNTMRVAEAFRTITRQADGAAYTLVLVSSRSNRGALWRRLVSGGLLRSSFRILSDVDDETLAGLYACAAVFAYVPLYEGFGIPAVEAMMAGCPIIVSDTGSLPEVVGQAGVYASPHSTEAISKALGAVLGDEALRGAMRARGRKQAQGFSWAKTAHRTVEFFERIRKAETLRPARH